MFTLSLFCQRWVCCTRAQVSCSCTDMSIARRVMCWLWPAVIARYGVLMVMLISTFLSYIGQCCGAALEQFAKLLRTQSGSLRVYFQLHPVIKQQVRPDLDRTGPAWRVRHCRLAGCFQQFADAVKRQAFRRPLLHQQQLL